MNPYAPHLGAGDPLEVIAASPGRLEQLVEAMGAERVETSPAPGKWSVREILGHLADTEVAFAFRLRQTLAEEHHVIQPFDQDKWADIKVDYQTRDALDAFSALRRWNIALIRKAGSEGRSKPVTHPERGPMTFGTIVETMAGHDLNHIRQIEAIRAKEA